MPASASGSARGCASRRTRRNWLFSDTVAGAKSSANLYSIIETAKANERDPYAYLRHVFTALPKAGSVEDIEALSPASVDNAFLTRSPD